MVTAVGDLARFFDSILRRRTYGATDNIVLEFWLGDHFMGEDFAATDNQKIRVKAVGTRPIEAILPDPRRQVHPQNVAGNGRR